MFGNTCLQVIFFSFFFQSTRISNTTCKKSHLKVRNRYKKHFILYFQKGTPPTEVTDKSNNCPHILRFVSPPGDDLQCTLFQLNRGFLMECRSASKALYCLLAAHYVFDISYNQNKIKDILFFLQEDC